jgi:hypothetical protein
MNKQLGWLLEPKGNFVLFPLKNSSDLQSRDPGSPRQPRIEQTRTAALVSFSSLQAFARVCN